MAAQKDKPDWQGELLLNESMARHTSWRVGGPAQRFYRPLDLQDLSAYLGQCPQDEPLLWLGLGSNLLVRDAGLTGSVIAMQGVIADIELCDKNMLRAGAGASCARVARMAARHGLVGAEFLAGIPGTMGGALAMNAGAFGGETWQIVANVTSINRRGEISVRQPQEYRIAYRQVQGVADEWFVGAYLRLQAGDAEAGQQRIKTLLAQRNTSQPIGLPSCGSVFRNPPGDYAARLIEAAGLKGFTVGRAQISDKHANFIINTGDATAADIEKLIKHAQAEVQQQFDVHLQTEVHIVGESGL
ncbi:MAG TPA: UDP-N-acetylmuramate dehydrogenase [Gammaproteobacteria bacterium]|nr:UDP-N-acetylmuramate dehydrogenase [Gammaproteobacteria bacterium]